MLSTFALGFDVNERSIDLRDRARDRIVNCFILLYGCELWSYQKVVVLFLELVRFATFKAEVLNQLIENPAQGWVPLHATCQFECILVAHQGEQALGMKGCEP
ncbi:MULTISPECIES: hypothetical protein [Bradyrhizobium]|uniref:hypothetical protein n=1 Tax=Bradyrhizobium TaxID=374 RepID=UPI0004024D13|nr:MULTISPECIES: hypothetical protein [Bradyrhizobium]